MTRRAVVLFGLGLIGQTGVIVLENKSQLPKLPRQGGKAFNTEDEMRALIEEYFAYCKAEEMPPLMIGLAQWMGVCKATLWKYVGGEYDTDLNRFSEVLELAKDYTEHDKVTNGLTGKYNANMTKFVLENNYGWAEKKAVTVTQEGTVKHEDVTPLKTMTPDEAYTAWQEATKAAVKEAVES